MTVAVIQARVSSSRLPGKVLKPLAGRPMIEREIERVRRAKQIDRIVLATSDDASDDELSDLCRAIGIECFRGSLDDVLDRYYRAAQSTSTNTVVRLTGDCPLVDPVVVDRVIDAYRQSRADYASNTIQPTYPDGLDVEVFSAAALESAWREARLPSEREHVTPFIHQHPERFRLTNVRSEQDLSQLRWTVDTPEDYEFVRSVYGALFERMPDFDTAAVLALLEREPHLQCINSHRERNEGYMRSLARDNEGGGPR